MGPFLDTASAAYVLQRVDFSQGYYGIKGKLGDSILLAAATLGPGCRHISRRILTDLYITSHSDVPIHG